MKYLALALCVCAMATSTGQSASCSSNCLVRVGQPFIVTAVTESDLRDYRLIVNSSVSQVAPVFVGAAVEFVVPNGLATIGTYFVSVEATMTTGQIARTDSVALTVVRRRVKA